MPTVTCECTECDRRFDVPVDENGKTTDFEPIKEHGSEFHENEKWDYRSVE